MDAWNRLRDIFQDNKHSHVVTLEAEFSNTKMENFPNALAYCQHLKSLVDQLKNVEAPVSESRFVIQLVSGLPCVLFDEFKDNLSIRGLLVSIAGRLRYM